MNKLSKTTGFKEINTKNEQHYLLKRADFNRRVCRLHRVDYEARGLRVIKEAIKTVRMLLKTADKREAPALAKSLVELLDRQRILLGMPLPTATVAKAKEPGADMPLLEAAVVTETLAEPKLTENNEQQNYDNNTTKT